MIMEVSFLFLSCRGCCTVVGVSDRHTLYGSLLPITSLSVPVRVRGKSGNQDPSLGYISHRSTRLISYQQCTVIINFTIIQWVVRLIKDQSLAQEKGSRFVYCFISFYYCTKVKLYTLIVCLISSFFFSNYIYCEYFSTCIECF